MQGEREAGRGWVSAPRKAAYCLGVAPRLRVDSSLRVHSSLLGPGTFAGICPGWLSPWKV